MQRKVAIVVSHPIQHFCPLYRALANTADLNLKVFFGSSAGLKRYYDPAFRTNVKWKPGLVDGFDHEFLAGAENKSVLRSVCSKDLDRQLDQFNPDVVQIYGFYHNISRNAYWWAVRRNKYILYVSDSEHRQARSTLALLKKRILMPVLFRRINAFLTIGDCNEAYYHLYGVPHERCFRCPIPVDEEALDEAIVHREEYRLRVRAKLKIPRDALLALTVGKLIERKRPADAIRAVAGLHSGHGPTMLFLALIGDGPERHRLEKLGKSTGHNGIRFVGFVPVADLPAYYVAGDILIHPASVDPHPLAVAEAIYCGLPVIVSDRVGCVGPTDDIRLGRNGFEVTCGDISALKHTLQRLATDRVIRSKMSDESFRIRQERTLEISKNAYVAAALGASRDVAAAHRLGIVRVSS